MLDSICKFLSISLFAANIQSVDLQQRDDIPAYLDSRNLVNQELLVKSVFNCKLLNTAYNDYTIALVDHIYVDDRNYLTFTDGPIYKNAR